MPASPPPSLPPSFPHMVLIRSGLRDSSQRKWLCTESFCEGEEGEGERAERKKERKEGRGWGQKMGEAGRLQHTALPSQCRVSATAHPCGLLTLPVRSEGPEKNPGSPLTLQLPAGEAGGSQPLPRVLGTFRSPSRAGCQGPWSHLRASTGQRTEPSGVYWLSPHCAKETGEATTLNSKDNPYNSASQWFQDPEWVIWPELFGTCA